MVLEGASQGAHQGETNQYRGSYKQPGGKLINATIRVGADETLESVNFDGDFFAERSGGQDASLQTAAQALAGMSIHSALTDFESAIRSGLPSDLELMGVDSRGMAFAVARAIAAYEQKLGLGNDSSASRLGTDRVQTHGESSYPPQHAGERELTPSLIEERWSRLDLHIVDPDVSARTPFEPAMQMALDEVIARRTASGDLPPLLRFWEWAGPAVILGLNQSVSNEVNESAARELGIAVVRRVTGGGAMFVEPGNTITYSLTTPLSFVSGLSANAAYELCDSWVFGALHSIGIAASHEPINDISSPAGKIGGAAARRFPVPEPGALLHHTTMAYDIDATKMLQVLRVNKEKSADKPVKSAAKRVDPMRSQSGMSRRQILAAFADYLHRSVPHISSTDLPGSVVSEARDLAAAKFATGEWTYRIP